MYPDQNYISKESLKTQRRILNHLQFYTMVIIISLVIALVSSIFGWVTLSGQTTDNPDQDYYNLLKADIALTPPYFNEYVKLKTTSKYLVLGSAILFIATTVLVKTETVTDGFTINMLYGTAIVSGALGWSFDLAAVKRLKEPKDVKYKKKHLKWMIVHPRYQHEF